MRIVKEMSLSSFEFWGGAVENAKRFTLEELEIIENCFEEIFLYEAPTETEVNDLFWFEIETLCDLAGIDYAEFKMRGQ